MKPITKKLLEAGLIEENTVDILRRWLLLSAEEAEQLGVSKEIRQTLESLVEQLEEILDEEPKLKETVLEISIRKPPTSYWAPLTGGFSTVEDAMGRLIVDPLLELVVGDVIYKDALKWQIESIDPIYINDSVVAKMLSVEKVK